MVERDEVREGREGPSIEPRTVVLVVLAALLVWFFLVNLDNVEVRILVPEVTISLAVALLISAVLGLGIGYMSGRAAGRRRWRR